MSKTNLVLVLGDQLSPGIAALKAADRTRDIVLMVEVTEEATYVRHHKKKIAFLFSAMRHFAKDLRDDDWTVDYVTLDDPDNTGSFSGEAGRAVKRHDPEKIVVTEPSEWRVAEMLASWTDDLELAVDILEDDRFLCSRPDFEAWAGDRKELRMEYFYREMRRKTGLLMNDGEPEGGRWNFDKDNRKAAGADLDFPRPQECAPDTITGQVLELVEARFSDHFGDLEPFWFAVTAKDANRALDAFMDHALACFGDYQDAMLEGEKFLYHSVLALYMNAGLLDPLAVCRRVESAWRQGHAPLNAAEGFIRQIIGWREYVRGIYWLKMPDYRDENRLDAKRALPDFYWSGKTDMACLRAAIAQTKEEAYAHHIQRLMITGNFAMLVGVRPREVHEWYLAVYADAYEWVELPNTIGMSQYADGGLLGSKPYAASGNYINKMSNHCAGCVYTVSQKTGEGACPFNALYWDFLVRNRDRLGDNHRLGRVYSTWDRMDDGRKSAYRDHAAAFLADLS